MAVVEGCECVGRCADPRLIAVDDVGDDEEDNENDSAHAPLPFPERRGSVFGCTHGKSPPIWFRCGMTKR